MNSQTRWTVLCEWDPSRWWVITVEGVDGGFSQCRRLDQAAQNAAEVIKLMTGQTVSPDQISVKPAFPGPAGDLARQAHESRESAIAAEQSAVKVTRDAVAALRAEKLPMRDVGALVGLTFQRVHQLLGSSSQSLARQAAKAASTGSEGKAAAPAGSTTGRRSRRSSATAPGRTRSTARPKTAGPAGPPRQLADSPYHADRPWPEN